MSKKTPEVRNYFMRADGGTMSLIPTTTPGGDWVPWDCVGGFVQDGIKLRRFLRLIVAATNGDPIAVRVMDRMEDHPSRGVPLEDGSVSVLQMQGLLDDVLTYADEEGFTNEDEAAATAAADVPAA